MNKFESIGIATMNLLAKGDVIESVRIGNIRDAKPDSHYFVFRIMNKSGDKYAVVEEVNKIDGEVYEIASTERTGCEEDKLLSWLGWTE